MEGMTEIIETTAGEVAAELARRGVEPQAVVTVVVEPADWLSKARAAARARVIAAGLTDDDIDRLIKEARKEANEEMRREAEQSSKS